MMSDEKVPRYDMTVDIGPYCTRVDSVQEEMDDGDWVKAEDHDRIVERLTRERDRLREQVEAFIAETDIYSKYADPDTPASPEDRWIGQWHAMFRKALEESDGA